MKIFNTIQELYSYCLFCPICQDMTREIMVEVGPNEAFKLSSFKKENHILILDCVFRSKKQNFRLHCDINCLDNSFKMSINDPDYDVYLEEKYEVNRASTPYFYFYFGGACYECKNSYINSKDLELDLINSTVYKIGVEREGATIIDKESAYQLMFNYDENNMSIIKFLNSEDLDYDDILDVEPLILPIINFDFSKKSKVLQKIKTLINFS